LGKSDIVATPCIVTARYPRAVKWSVLLALAVVSCGARSITLHFPDNVSLGELRVVEDVNCFTCGNGHQELGDARGQKIVRLPANRWYISLTMPKQAAALVPYLDEPSLRAIGDINLAQSDVRDGDLKHLDSIELRSIDLSKTHITGEGLRYLHPHSHFIFVTLTDCPQLDPRFLAHFRGWKRATIRVTTASYGHEPDSDRERALLAAARHFICDDQPEQTCGTQIR